MTGIYRFAHLPKNPTFFHLKALGVTLTRSPWTAPMPGWSPSTRWKTGTFQTQRFQRRSSTPCAWQMVTGKAPVGNERINMG